MHYRGKPWSRGYDEAKWEATLSALNNADLLDAFATQRPLPSGFGVAFDERIVEYPWLFANLKLSDGNKLLDAGSTLNFETIIKLPEIKKTHLTILNLNPERFCFWQNGISYVFDDIRSTPFKNDYFEVIAFISTLEHIGMNNDLYTGRSDDINVGDFKKALVEMKRILKPGGRMLVTVPFGRYENHDFFQQFDKQLIDRAIKTFSPAKIVETYYKYSKEGWQISTADDCTDQKYFNIHKNKNIDPDMAAASRAIACLILTK